MRIKDLMLRFFEVDFIAFRMASKDEYEMKSINYLHYMFLAAQFYKECHQPNDGHDVAEELRIICQLLIYGA
jgi:hypothetical protein